MFVQCRRLYKNIKTFNFTKDEFPHIYFLRTLPRLFQEHRLQEQLSMEKNIKCEVFYINSCPAKSCSTMHLQRKTSKIIYQEFIFSKIAGPHPAVFDHKKNNIASHTHTHTKYCFTFRMFKHPPETLFSKRVRTQ